MSTPRPIPDLLAEMLADQLNRRIPRTRDITHERMAAHLRLVRTFPTENADVVHQAIAEAYEPYSVVR